ncbi:MAG: sulfate ABC transporter substrate-binding protein [bacterium]|jgi:sulfate transport system substrate-binding protein|nr:sulfate ABC transporter substrate-binding protein [bacterium]
MKYANGRRNVLILVVLAVLGSSLGGWGQEAKELLNVSYDPTRELYLEINQKFAAWWKVESGEELVIRQSHGGSGKQARAVIDGLEADVVTLALAYDIDAIAKNSDLLPAGWQARLPNHSCPYTSTIVFLVRKGNPKKIADWDDLVRPGIKVITPNPKTSGGARWNYLAAWGYAWKKWGGDEAQVEAFMKRLFQNVPVLDTGARGSTNTFLRGMGDVLLAWENEALLALEKLGKAKFEIVTPSISILAEPPVAWIDKNCEKHKSQKTAEAYLRFLYTPESQALCARYFYRPSDPVVAEQFKDQFPAMELLKLDEQFGSWEAVQNKHFSDGGIFDQIFVDE